jgi:hypothetical protein
MPCPLGQDVSRQKLSLQSRASFQIEPGFDILMLLL